MRTRVRKGVKSALVGEKNTEGAARVLANKSGFILVAYALAKTSGSSCGVWTYVGQRLGAAVGTTTLKYGEEPLNVAAAGLIRARR